LIGLAGPVHFCAAIKAANKPAQWYTLQPLFIPGLHAPGAKRNGGSLGIPLRSGAKRRTLAPAGGSSPLYTYTPRQRGGSPITVRASKYSLIGRYVRLSQFPPPGYYVDFPDIDIPDVLGGSNYKQLRDEDIERIALDLRNHWKLGEGPCTDVVALLERIGVVVSTIEMGTSKLDGLCSWASDDGRPHILLATDKMCLPRRQMDAAHEMAHAVLHKGVTKEELKKDLKAIEAQAFRLASAFLLPSTTYPHEVRHPSLAALLSLKERWRVSVKAQIRRLSDLGLVPQNHATDLYKLYSAKGWNREEPLDRQWAIPEPRNLRDALGVIIDSNVRTKADLLSVEFTMSSGDIENLTNLPPGWFSERTGEVVQLKHAAHSPSVNMETPGLILPFNRK
jgi:Zn-dependent peptidase ImmA (M78 family)